MTEPHDPIDPRLPPHPVASEPIHKAEVAPSTGQAAPAADKELLIDHLMHAAPSTGDVAERAPSRATPLWLTILLAILLAGGGVALWQTRSVPPPPVASIDPARVAALETDLRAAQQKIAALEQRPLPTPPDTTRIAAVEAQTRDLLAQTREIAARKIPDLAPLDARITALEQKPAPVIPDVAKEVQTAVAGASAALDAKIAATNTQLQQDADQAKARAAQLDQRATQADQRAAQADQRVAQAEARTVQANRARVALTALDAGQPIGAINGAPLAVARYATAAPPTEPSLRLSFSRYVAAAEAASQPSAENHTFAERMWMRAQGLVTVRQGDHVLVGTPAATTLEAARGRLDAGDLAGAVKTLDALDPPAASAMAPWKTDAQNLLDARAGLAGLMAKS